MKTKQKQKSAQKTSVNGDRYQVYDDLVSLLHTEYYSGKSVESMAVQAGVATTTLYFWMEGKVKKPRIDTLVKVATSLGKDIGLL